MPIAGLSVALELSGASRIQRSALCSFRFPIVLEEFTGKARQSLHVW